MELKSRLCFEFTLVWVLACLVGIRGRDSDWTGLDWGYICGLDWIGI